MCSPGLGKKAQKCAKKNAHNEITFTGFNFGAQHPVCIADVLLWKAGYMEGHLCDRCTCI